MQSGIRTDPRDGSYSTRNLRQQPPNALLQLRWAKRFSQKRNADHLEFGMARSFKSDWWGSFRNDRGRSRVWSGSRETRAGMIRGATTARMRWRWLAKG